MNKLHTLLLVAILVLVAVSLFSSRGGVVGSVSVSDEYQSVQTGLSVASGTVLKPVPGVLGSIVVTTTAVGTLRIYNATTSDVTLRALATSSLEILAVLSDPTAGTYTYDVEADEGMIVTFIGLQASTTITYR